jgi:transcription elongation factor Elf1
MDLRLRHPASFVRARPTIECAQCGEQLFMPEWSEYLDKNRARHLWCCEACGYKFETTVRFAAA